MTGIERAVAAYPADFYSKDGVEVFPAVWPDGSQRRIAYVKCEEKYWAVEFSTEDDFHDAISKIEKAVKAHSTLGLEARRPHR